MFKTVQAKIDSALNYLINLTKFNNYNIFYLSIPERIISYCIGHETIHYFT